MPRQIFVNPKDTERLYLWRDTEGDSYWIDVKANLSAKETQQVQSSGIDHMMAKANQAKAQIEGEEPAQDQEIKLGLDMGAMKLTRAEKYIVAWSFTRTNSGGQESPVPVNAESIGELLPEVFEEIEKQLDAYIAKREAEKKAKLGGTTSPSVSASAA